MNPFLELGPLMHFSSGIRAHVVNSTLFSGIRAPMVSGIRASLVLELGPLPVSGIRARHGSCHIFVLARSFVLASFLLLPTFRSCQLYVLASFLFLPTLRLC